MATHRHAIDAMLYHPGTWRLFKSCYSDYCFEREERDSNNRIFHIGCPSFMDGVFCTTYPVFSMRSNVNYIDMTTRFRAIWQAKRWMLIARGRKNARYGLSCLSLQCPEFPCELFAAICQSLSVPLVVRSRKDRSQCSGGARVCLPQITDSSEKLM